MVDSRRAPSLTARTRKDETIMTFPRISFSLVLSVPLLGAAPGCSDDGLSNEGASPTGSTDTTDTTGASGDDASTGSASGSDPSTGPADSTGEAGSDSTGEAGSDSTGEAGSDSTGEAGLSIAGTWFEEFAPGEGITHVIDETRWDQLADFGDAIFHVEAYDEAAQWVVAQGDAANEFSPELYSRFDWTWDGADLYYCTAVFDAATAADAMAAPASDPSDLDAGCGGFPWSRLMPVPR